LGNGGRGLILPAGDQFGSPAEALRFQEPGRENRLVTGCDAAVDELVVARTDQFTGLAEFLAVARRSSFRTASADLGVTPSAVSQAIRSLEARVGSPLFQRTTRKVALTEAGTALLEQLSPAARTIAEALESVNALRSHPTGTLRLSVPRIAMELVLWDVIPAFRAAFPEVTLDVDINDSSVDITSGQFDAGIRMGEYIERDMIAVRLTDDFRCVVVGAPAYFKARGRPASPEALTGHECIRYRFPTARTVYRWEFFDGKRMYAVEPRGGLIVNDHLSMIALARRGLGLAYTVDLLVEHPLAEGALQEALERHVPATSGLFLYFPANSQSQPKLRAFIDLARKRLRERRHRVRGAGARINRRRPGKQAHLPPLRP
jgi:DNA-binding transcriptional LysR family regulator